MNASDFILQVNDLRTYFYTRRGVVKAIDGISFFIRKGRILGLVGETGSGKSVTALSIMRLIESPGRIISGSIFLDGVNLLDLSKDEMRQVRGRDVSLVFQQARTSLNPLQRIGYQIAEAIRAHRDVSQTDAETEGVQMLQKLGLPDPVHMMKRYPFELSGGMAQRVVIAMALLFKPKLLIADEPTSALDVTIQAQILELISELVRETGASVLFITHDLGVAAEVCDEIMVLYAGKVAELAPKTLFFKEPKHPYTKALIESMPRRRRYARLSQIPGEVPDLINPPTGCRFHPRCPSRFDICDKIEPRLLMLRSSSVSCHLYDGEKNSGA